MYFTQEDYQKIVQYLKENGYKDSELPTADALNADDLIAIVQQDTSKKVTIDRLMDELVPYLDAEVIETKHIKDGNVTHAKLSADSVDTTNIVDHTIQSADLSREEDANGAAVKTENIQDDAVTADKLQNGAVEVSKLSGEVKKIIAGGGKGVTPYSITYNVENATITEKPASMFAFGSATVVFKAKSGYNLPTDADVTVTGAIKESYIVDGNYGILNINTPTDSVVVTTSINSFSVSYSLSNISFNTKPTTVAKGANLQYNITPSSYYKLPESLSVTGSSNFVYTRTSDNAGTLSISDVEANLAISGTGAIVNTNYWGVSSVNTAATVKSKLSDLTSFGNNTASGTKTFVITADKPYMWVISSKALTFSTGGLPYDMDVEIVDGVYYYHSSAQTAGSSLTITMS